VKMLALYACFVQSLLVYLLQAMYRKQVQNSHAKDIIVIIELFCLHPLYNTGGVQYNDKFIIPKQARCICCVNVPFHQMGCSKPYGWVEP
jgi:hypothetical protein